MPKSIAMLNRLTGDVESVLAKHNYMKDAVRINKCFGFRQCHSIFCIRCASRRAHLERKHLLHSLPKLLFQSPNYQLWFITGAVADSPYVRGAAQAAVTGMKRLLKHPRLRNRVIAHFAVVEVAHKRGRQHPCAHVHALVVTKPMDKGKYRISREDWLLLWEEACPQYRKRLQASKGGANRNLAEHRSLVAVQVPRKHSDLLRVIRYCTKWANPRHAANDLRRLLVPDPEMYINRQKALKGVSRFFGELHKRKSR